MLLGSLLPVHSSTPAETLLQPKKALYESASVPETLAWRFMGSSMWSYKSPNMGYNYRLPYLEPYV